MPTNWQDYCKAEGLAMRDGGLEVKFDNERGQRVSVEDRGDALLLYSVVARCSVVEGLFDPALLTWMRNRACTLAGFRIDERGRLICEIWIPKAGLVASEFQFVVRHIAAEADRFEFQLTGSDKE